MNYTVIYKYPLAVKDKQKISMPAYNMPLSVQLQGTQIVLWAEVQADVPVDRMIDVTILMYGTGHTIPLDGRFRNYIGTVQDHRGLVWHVYQLLSESIKL